MEQEEMIWIICYVNTKFLPNVLEDLAKHPKYKNIEVYIPTVKLLTKKFKNKEIFEEIPLLFNYGFFKIPKYFITHSSFLDKLKKDVPSIYAWVRDPANLMKEKPKLRKDNKSVFDYRKSGFAIATSEEVASLMLSEKTRSIYTAKDIENLHPGKIITLHGYPFDGVEAEVVKVDKQGKQVEVKLLLAKHLKHIKVSFDNIFYTVYRSHIVNEIKEKSLEELQGANNNIDGLLAKLNIT